MSLKDIIFPQTSYSIPKKFLGVIGIVAYYTIGYLYLNQITMHSSRFYDVSLAWESHIPFYKEFVFAYAFVYILVVILILTMQDDKLLWQAVKAFFVNANIQFLFFYFFPVVIERPTVFPNGTFVQDFAAFWFWLDNPTTLFPSAHVSMGFLSALFTYRANKTVGWISLGCAVIVAVSVLFMKQHYVADVVSGFFLGCAVFYTFDPERIPFRTRLQLKALLPGKSLS